VTAALNANEDRHSQRAFSFSSSSDGGDDSEAPRERGSPLPTATSNLDPPPRMPKMTLWQWLEMKLFRGLF